MAHNHTNWGTQTGSPGSPPRGASSPVLPARTPRHAGRKQAFQDLSQQGPCELVAMLQHQLENKAWGPVVHIVHLAKFMAQCKPYMAKQLAGSGAPQVLMAVMKGVLEGDEGTDAVEVVMAQASELLLLLVESDQAECAADVLTAEGVAVLLQALTSPVGGTRARQHVAHLLRHVVASGPAWRGPLLAHGGLEGLPRALHDPVAACDLLFMQEVLWALVGLVDAAVAGGGDLGNPHVILGTLVPLLQLLQLPQLSHLAHISALVMRVLHVLASGDDYSKQFLGQAGVVDILVEAIRSERRAEMAAAGAGLDGQADSGGWPGRSYGRQSSLVSRTGSNLAEPDPERLAQSGLVPLRRSSHDGPQSGAGAGASAGGNSTGGRSHTHGRDAGLPLGIRVSGWDRLMAALLLRAILLEGTAETPRPGAGGAAAAPRPSRLSVSALACYGLLFPVLVDGHTSTVHRLCVVKEAVVAVKTLVCDSVANQEKAVAAGALPLLVHLVSTGDVTLAWQAADALSNLTTAEQAPSLLAQGVVEELTHLLQESADALHLMTVRKQIEDHAVTGLVPDLPTPHAAYQHKPRHKKTNAAAPPRVQLVGRQQLSFSVSGCMYTNHGSYSMCDYCVPSACLRALLRLLGVCSNHLTALPTPPAATTNGRHSRQASASDSAATAAWLGGGRSSAAAAQGLGGAARFVAAGGLYTLFLILHHELSGSHHSKLASSLTSLLNLVLDTGIDVQDEVRKVGGLALMVSLMESLARPQGLTDIYQLRVQVSLAMQRLVEGNSANKLLIRERGLIPLLVTMLQSSLDPNSAQVLDDKEQVTACVLDLLSSCIADSPANQDALLSSGGLRLLNNMLTAATQPPVKEAGMGSFSSGNKAPPGSSLVRLRGSAQLLAAAVRASGFLAAGCLPAQLALLGSPVLMTLVQFSEQQPASNLAQCVVFTACQLIRVHPQGKSHAVGSGLLTLLLKMLHTAPPGPHIAAAAQGLYAMCLGDVDMQNEVVAQGGLGMVETIIRGNSVWRVHALWLLCCLLHGNSYAKNTARQTDGLVASLMDVLRKQIVAQPELTVAAAHALAQMCQSNHANQEIVADEGGMESVIEILQVALQSGKPTPPPPPPPAPSGGGSRNSSSGLTPGGSNSIGLPPCMALAVGPLHRRRQPGAAVGGGLLIPPWVELGALTGAVGCAGVLDAGLRLLSAMLEFNATNKKLVRESGCLALVADLLLRAAQVRDLAALRKVHLLPAVAAACSAVAHAAQDCEENQQRLVTGHEDLAPALFRLLSIEEPYVALEAARALEYMVIRSDLVHDQGEDRPEFESDAVRTLVTVLHTRGGPAAGAAAQASAALALQAGFWGQQAATDGHGPSPAAYGATVVMTAAMVREAAAVMAAIVVAVQTAVPAHPAAGTTNGSNGANGHAVGGAGPHGAAPAKPAAPAPKPPTKGMARLFKWRQDAGPAAAKPAPVPDAVAAVAAAEAARTLNHQPSESGFADAILGEALGHGGGAGSQGTSSSSSYVTAERGGSEITPEIMPAPPHDGPLPGQQLGPLPTQQPLGTFIADHTHGLITVQSLQDPNHVMGVDEWLRLAGQSAAAFQPVADLVSEGPWRMVKVHLAWLLFLLAARAPANRELIAKLERAVVTPVAGQLANAEAFYASAEAAEAVAAASNQPSPALPVSTIAQEVQHVNRSFRMSASPVVTPTTSHMPTNALASSQPSSPPRNPLPQQQQQQVSSPVQQPAAAASSPPKVVNSSPQRTQEAASHTASWASQATGPSTSQSQLQPEVAPPSTRPLTSALASMDSGGSITHSVGRTGTGSYLSDDEEMEQIRREVEMLAGVGKTMRTSEPS